MFDIIIIGGGPSGLTAAIYGRRAGKSVLVIEKGAFGGQMTFSPKIENYPGFESVSGNELADSMVSHALALGTEFEAEEVTGVDASGDIKKVFAGDTVYECKAVIVAVGAKHRMLGLPGEEELVGNGISFCAVCDGAFYKDKTVAVVGGGNSALQEATLLSEICKKVTVVQNLDFFTGEATLANALEAKENVEILLGHTVSSFESKNGELSALTVVSSKDGSVKTLSVDGAFIAVGLIPQNGAFENILPLDQWGYAVSDESCTVPQKGVFVAGDCRTKRIRQVSTATADGAVAALAACKYIDGQESLK